jgi:hypothetical protein
MTSLSVGALIARRYQVERRLLGDAYVTFDMLLRERVVLALIGLRAEQALDPACCTAEYVQATTVSRR